MSNRFETSPSPLTEYLNISDWLHVDEYLQMPPKEKVKGITVWGTCGPGDGAQHLAPADIFCEYLEWSSRGSY